jgi:hypothetical protein
MCGDIGASLGDGGERQEEDAVEGGVITDGTMDNHCASPREDAEDAMQVVMHLNSI